jgi:hypothetical protein
MLERALVFALSLTTAGAWSSPDAAGAAFTQGQSAGQKIESQHFEIHYRPALARDLEPVTRSAERAYDRISGQLNFTLRTKMALVMFASSGALTEDQVVAYAISDDVGPQQLKKTAHRLLGAEQHDRIRGGGAAGR